MRVGRMGVGVLALTALMAVAGCVPKGPRTFSVDQVLQITPAVGQTAYVALKEPVLHQRQAQIMTGRWINPPQQVRLGSFSYTAAGLFLLTEDGAYCGSLIYASGLSAGKKRLVCWHDNHYKALKVDYTVVEEIAPGTKGSQRRIEYGGLSGTTISLYYKTLSEIKRDLLRPESAQELKFDLNNGRIIEIEGARIEVLEATDRGMHYKLLSAFPG
jgi:hypothetical protein